MKEKTIKKVAKKVATSANYLLEIDALIRDYAIKNNLNLSVAMSVANESKKGVFVSGGLFFHGENKELRPKLLTGVATIVAKELD
ncbi:hypothetical protein [Bernardetia sp.]|uniref:hypothetical protein n=1 Tax=Bernardetia sp. TaxID=1937974 RepID=UPI0025B9E31C|nr:hypothetical protein [Bernardetia sp.]